MKNLIQAILVLGSVAHTPHDNPHTIILKKKTLTQAWPQWLMPIILATQEAEMRRTAV
jgi:hypothetical protein